MIPNIFTTEELEFFRSLPEVLQAEARLAKASNVYFQANLPESFRQILKERLNVDVSSAVPFRWIRGDTRSHVDRGAQSFDRTHLVYLTDGEGTFEIGDDAYSITAGSGFVFPEGVHHQVTGTNGSSRLLLGPMSETGMAVGVPGLYADGATDTIYLRPGTETEVEYRINDGEWTTVNFPATITNTNVDAANNVLKVYLTDNLTITGGASYFQCLSDGIQFGNKSQGNEGDTFVGQLAVNIVDVPDYPGFILNGNLVSGDGYNNISVYNLVVSSQGSTTLAEEAGWIGQAYFGYGASNNIIMSCSTQGTISNGGGGIVGAYAGNTGGSLKIVACIATGDVGTLGGGIAGVYPGYDGGSIEIEQCISFGSEIGTNGGGIVGGYAGGAGGSCTITKCYSAGSIGDNAGGIAGAYSGDDSGQASVTYCYSTGSIGTNAGGIFGRYSTSNGGQATASHCYTTGAISATGGGIVGADATGVLNLTNCYTAGSTAMAEGYIIAGSDLVPVSNYSEAANDTSGWNDTNAAPTLGGPSPGGTTTYWVSTGTNAPYELNRFLSSPYSLLVTTNGTTLLTQYSQTISAGNATQGVVVPTEILSFSTLGLSEPTITIDSVTGVLQTTTATPAGEYTFTVRGANFILYINTLVILTVQGVPAPSPPTATPAPRGKGFDFELLTNINMGKRFIDERLTNPNIRFNSYKDYLRYRTAIANYAAK